MEILKNFPKKSLCHHIHKAGEIWALGKQCQNRSKFSSWFLCGLCFPAYTVRWFLFVIHVKISRGKRSDCNLHPGWFTASCHMKREACIEEEEIRFSTDKNSKLLLKMQVFGGFNCCLFYCDFLSRFSCQRAFRTVAILGVLTRKRFEPELTSLGAGKYSLLWH